MLTFIVRRLVYLIPTLLGVTAIAFTLAHIAGDPATANLPPDASTEQRAAFRRAYGLDQPLPTQYALYLSRLVSGDLGMSISYQEPVSRLILRRLPATVELALVSLGIVLAIGIPLGVLAAVLKGSLVDFLVRLLALVGQSIATFWLGIMLIMVVAVRWQVLPPSGRGGWENLVLPSVTLASYMLALIVRLTRSGMLEVLTQDFIRTARSKGLNHWQVEYKHALRNAIIPVITVVGIQLGHLLSGAIVTETVFSWPGLGLLVVDSIYRRDQQVIQGVVLVMALTYALTNLFTDVLYGVIDPRIRFD